MEQYIGRSPLGFISWGTLIPKPYNIQRVYQSRLGMVSVCGIVMYNLFILINDKCEYMCKLKQNLEIPKTSILDY